jgi:hypothetical protein
MSEGPSNMREILNKSLKILQHMFLHLVGSVGHVVHSGVFGPRNIDALFLCSGGTYTDSTKTAPGDLTPKLCFCFRSDLRVTYRIPMHLSCATSTHYFSCVGGPGVVSTKSVFGHLTPDLCLCI